MMGKEKVKYQHRLHTSERVVGLGKGGIPFLEGMLYQRDHPHLF